MTTRYLRNTQWIGYQWNIQREPQMPDEPSRRFNDQYMLRFPEGMRDKIRAAAAANGRSMNSEIIARLEHTMRLDQENRSSRQFAYGPGPGSLNSGRERDYLRVVDLFKEIRLLLDETEDLATNGLADERADQDHFDDLDRDVDGSSK